MAAASGSVEELNTLTVTTIRLLEQLEGVTQPIYTNRLREDPIHASPATSTDAPPDALSLAHDSTSLVRAHATKISVLIINEPFTPSAICKVLRELVSKAIPGLASAAQYCTVDKYSLEVRRELARNAHTVLRELRGLIERIPTDGKILTADQKNTSSGTAKNANKGSVVATGTLWAACDDLLKFSKPGVAGYIITRFEQFKALLEDAIEELKEWSEEADEEEEEEDDGDFADDADRDSGVGSEVPTAQDMIDEMFDSVKHIPAGDPNKIRGRLESFQKKLRLSKLFYQAIIKRRLKTLPSLPSPETSTDVTKRLDEMASIARAISQHVDDTALAFYELDVGSIDSNQQEFITMLLKLSKLLKRPWAKDRDEFSDWTDKFEAQMKTAAVEPSK